MNIPHAVTSQSLGLGYTSLFEGTSESGSVRRPQKRSSLLFSSKKKQIIISLPIFTADFKYELPSGQVHGKGGISPTLSPHPVGTGLARIRCSLVGRLPHRHVPPPTQKRVSLIFSLDSLCHSFMHPPTVIPIYFHHSFYSCFTPFSFDSFFSFRNLYLLGLEVLTEQTNTNNI